MGRKNLIDLNSMHPINSRWQDLRRDWRVKRPASFLSASTPCVLVRSPRACYPQQNGAKKAGVFLLLSSVGRECSHVRETMLPTELVQGLLEGMTQGEFC